MKKLSGPQMKELCQLIGDHFDRPGLEMALHFFEPARKLSSYSEADSLDIAIFEAVKRFDREDEVAQLAAALRARNAAASLRDGLDAILAAAGAAKPDTADPCDELLLSSRPLLAVLDRVELRLHLREFGKMAESWARALSITGDPACGKSHSWTLAQHVAAHFGVKTLKLDFAPPYGATGVGAAAERIAFAMRLPSASLQRDVLQDAPTEAKLAEKFVAWLVGESRTLQERWWLCLDSLDRPEAQSVRDLLVPRLLIEAADGNLGNIQIVLLGYNARTVRAARAIVLHENARGLDRQDFVNFFKACAARKGVELALQDVSDMVAYVLKDHAPPFDHAAMDDIGDRLPEILKEVLP